MARISGMVLGLALLIVLSSIATPASAWDSDDDDDHKPKYKYKQKHNPHYGHAPIVAPPLIRQPILVPPHPGDRYDYAPRQYPNDPYNPYRIDYGAPQYQPLPEYQPVPDYQPVPEYQSVPHDQTSPQVPLAPPPLPPEQLFGDNPSDTITGPSFAANEPELANAPDYRAGQFVPVETELYPHVRVKGQDAIPRHAVPQIIAVRSPDPFRFPGMVYVQVYTLPGRPKVEVENGGAKIEMKYDDFEVKIVSAKGIVSVEYDD